MAPVHRSVGEVRAAWQEIDHAAVRLTRLRVEPGRRSGPPHSHASAEALSFVLGGSGLLWQGGATCAIAAGDAICAPAGGSPHCLVAGDEGLDVLVFSEAAPAPSFDAYPLRVPAPGPRPANVVAWTDAPYEELLDVAGYGATEHDLGGPTGSVRSGLRRQVVSPGLMNCPPHWHAIEHEVFSVLEGGGTLQLWANDGTLAAEHAVGPGDVVRRPFGRARLAHAFVGGDAGLTMLVYGTRRDEEIVYFPRSRKIHLGGVTVRVDPVADYWDGEV